MKTKILLCLLIFVMFIPAQSFAQLEAGVSETDITPVTGLKMYGYAQRKDNTSTGVLDPLYLRILVFRSGEKSVGFVVYDMGKTFSREIREDLRNDIRRETGLKEIIFMATHTHSGPTIPDRDKIENSPEWEKKIYNQTITAAKEAYNSLKPVKIGVGFGKADYNYNRIRIHHDEKVEMLWRYRGNVPQAHVDHTVAVMKIDDLAGNTIAVVANYASHPVVFGAENFDYSADYPGALCAEVKKNIAGNPVCIFVTGACGDMNPYCWNIENKDKKEQMVEIGKGVAAEVIRVTGEIETKPCNNELSVLYEKKVFEVSSRWDKEKKYEVPVSVVLITPEIGWVGLPGEFFVEFQEEIRAKSPVKNMIVSGYTNGHLGYFPTVEAAVKGGYGANWSTNVAVGAGERCVVESLVGLYELLGKLKPEPPR